MDFLIERNVSLDQNLNLNLNLNLSQHYTYLGKRLQTKINKL